MNRRKRTNESKKLNSKQKKKSLKEILINYEVRTKHIDQSWDYKGANTKEYTHCFHIYPAMMIPQVARRLLDEFGQNAKLLFDPYCGTGTSLVEANLKGINAIGTDINNLACLIAKVKTTRLDLENLKKYISKFDDFVFKHSFLDLVDKDISIPKITNVDFWFSKVAQKKLSLILEFINNITDQDIADFFKVAFSETVRESSFVKIKEFKLVRDKDYYKRVDPDVFGIMNYKLNRNLKGLQEFLEELDDGVNTKVYNFNTVYGIPRNIIKPNSIDIILTSPPYGDSRTTVAYGQFSRFSSEWLSLNNANEVDAISMGGRREKIIQPLNYPVIDEIINKIYSYDKKRALDVFSFFKDYKKSIENISSIVKNGGFVCYVVGNRTVKGIQIPTDEITKTIFERIGFTHVDTIVRNIPNKRMPLKNSPSNIPGLTSQTMRNEYIVIMQKK